MNYEKVQQEIGGIAEDIGLLQNTVIRAPFKDLPAVTSGKFWKYFWTLVKLKAVALYS